ncbi:GyrI-like domain-containing protein [uncultured Zobellia sp.]|uniref:GyrI-like domain-containing protein n=1 Tax=uncultured Zobellia sp. TaxID=255433 RepID=UPI0025942EB5|nr:GyrI-like domain-containing protein [uncultured Zobellia sp.]
MLRKILLGAGLILLTALVWYLFLKPEDYLATLKIKANPGTINQTIKLWESTLEDSRIIDQHQLNTFEHQITINDSTFNYKWTIEKIDDSLSLTQAHITNVNHSLKSKLLMLFTDTDFEKRSKKTIFQFHEKIQEHLDNFKVTIIGKEVLSNAFCAYIPLESTQFEKASKMMSNYRLLDRFALNPNAQTDGLPFIEVTKWNIEKDSITYNFCYPIKKTDSLPEHKIIKYKEFKGGNSLKAVYNGNYITSDRAWYSLLNEAEKLGIKTTGTPVEVFFTNPNMGSNELEWVAEIYLPIVDNKD